MVSAQLLFSAPWEIIRKFCPISTCSSACENFWAGPQFEIKLSFLFYALPFLWFTRFQQNFEETQVVSIREKNLKAYFTLVSPQTHLSLSLLLINFKNHSLIWSLTCTDKVLYFPSQPILPCAFIFNFEASDFVLMQDFTPGGWIWDFPRWIILFFFLVNTKSSRYWTWNFCCWTQNSCPNGYGI